MKKGYAYFSALVFFIFLVSCNNRPDLLPVVSFDKYKIADGFKIELAASEPLIEAPVAMDFDNKGRMWVVEMRGFMPDISGAGESIPNGRILILNDLDKDGRARRSTVFLDSLVLPRAISLVYGGLLYAAPPNLWFVEINNDKPGKRVLVDSMYAEEIANPEAQANGLLMNIDNWIYNANSSYRYRLLDGKWLKEPTSFRGQFGITKDNFGRLYYNYNEVQLVGDYVLPNSIISNPYLKPQEGINIKLTDDQRVYPLHPTTVNRGYVHGILSADSLLLRFTAACGPLVYRGDQFPADYFQNAFTCEPAANLVKRNILSFSSLKTTAAQAWNDREFLSASDEAFRPVNLANGPDGAMYVVDMHRGVIEHISSATPYYKNNVTEKKLDTLLHEGRILRIINKNKPLDKTTDIERKSTDELISYLQSGNGWLRDRAQQLLILRKDTTIIFALGEMVLDEKQDAIAKLHALYTLEGLHALSFDLLKKVAAVGDPLLTPHALILLKNYAGEQEIVKMKQLVDGLIKRNDTTVNLYIALALAPWIKEAPPIFLPTIGQLSATYKGSALFQEAVVSSLNGFEEKFQKFVSNEKDTVLEQALASAMKNRTQNVLNPIFVEQKPLRGGRTRGLEIYRSTCAACHGPDGNGVQHVAPSLRESHFIGGSTVRMGMILLYGIQDPMESKERNPEFNGAMPGFADIFSDEDIAGVIDYLRNSFVAADPRASYGKPSVKASEIKVLRGKRTTSLTRKELTNGKWDE